MLQHTDLDRGTTEGCFIGRHERSQNLGAVATNFSRTQGASLERQAPRRKCGYRLPRPGVVTGFRNRPSTSSRPASAEVFDEGLLRGDLLALNLSSGFLVFWPWPIRIVPAAIPDQ